MCTSKTFLKKFKKCSAEEFGDVIICDRCICRPSSQNCLCGLWHWQIIYSGCWCSCLWQLQLLSLMFLRCRHQEFKSSPVTKPISSKPFTLHSRCNYDFCVFSLLCPVFPPRWRSGVCVRTGWMCSPRSSSCPPCENWPQSSSSRVKKKEYGTNNLRLLALPNSDCAFTFTASVCSRRARHLRSAVVGHAEERLVGTAAAGDTDQVEGVSNEISHHQVCLLLSSFSAVPLDKAVRLSDTQVPHFIGFLLPGRSAQNTGWTKQQSEELETFSVS